MRFAAAAFVAGLLAVPVPIVAQTLTSTEDALPRVADFIKIDATSASPGYERLLLVFDKTLARVDLFIFPNENLPEADNVIGVFRNVARNGAGPGNTPFFSFPTDNARNTIQLIVTRPDALLRPYDQAMTLAWVDGQATITAFQHTEINTVTGGDFSCRFDIRSQLIIETYANENDENGMYREEPFAGPAAPFAQDFADMPLPGPCGAAHADWAQ